MFPPKKIITPSAFSISKSILILITCTFLILSSTLAVKTANAHNYTPLTPGNCESTRHHYIETEPGVGECWENESILDTVPDPLFGRFTSLGQIASLLLPSILILGGMVALLFLIWGGFKYMTAQGDPKAVASARGTIVSAVVGLLILISIIAILALLEGIFKINILTNAVAPVFAQGVDIGCAFKVGGLCVRDAFPTLGSLLTRIINVALAAAGLVFFFMLLWGGIRYMLARGDDKLIMEAKQTLTNATIGLLIIVSAFAIINLIALALGADISIF